MCASQYSSYGLHGIMNEIIDPQKSLLLRSTCDILPEIKYLNANSAENWKGISGIGYWDLGII